MAPAAAPVGTVLGLGRGAVVGIGLGVGRATRTAVAAFGVVGSAVAVAAGAVGISSTFSTAAELVGTFVDDSVGVEATPGEQPIAPASTSMNAVTARN